MPDLEVSVALQVEEGVATRDLNVDDLKAAATGDATEVTLTAVHATLETIAAALDNRYGGGKTPLDFTATAAGDTTILTPTAGKRIRVFWATALNDPDEPTSPAIRLKFEDGDTFYASFAIAHWEVFTGDVDKAVIVNLSDAGAVTGTLHYKEID